jgi:hypothetical protein
MSLIFLNSAELKPDIRLAQALSEFGAALDHRYRPSFKTWQTHSPPTENDVIRLAEEAIVMDGDFTEDPGNPLAQGSSRFWTKSRSLQGWAIFS